MTVTITTQGNPVNIASDHQTINVNMTNYDTSSVALVAAANASASAAQAALYDGPRLADVPAVITDNVLSYVSGAGKTVVAVGSYVLTRKEGFAYQVAASGASDQHITTAGGVKLYVMPTAAGYDVRAFGAPTDGVSDATPAIRAALTCANSLVIAGLASTILTPGATVVIPPIKFSLTSIAATLQVMCNLSATGAKFLVPAAYAGEAIRVGDDRSGYNLSVANIFLPDVYKPTGSAIISGSVGIRTVNCNKCRIFYGRVSYFDYGLHLGGIGEGTVYCDLFLGQINYCNQLVRIVPGSGGWFNSNNVHSGQLRQGGSRVTGQFHFYINGTSPATAIVGNRFIGTALEGDGAEYLIYTKGAYGNSWISPYVESGFVGVSCAVSGDTITATSHSLVVDDMVSFSATVLPTGMLDITPYWVVSVPTSNTFKVSRSKGGTAITFSTAGTAVKFYRQGRCYYDPTGTLTYNNRFINRFSPPSVYIDHIEVGQAYNNGEDGFTSIIRDAFDANDTPFYSVRNRSTGVSRPGFASYPTSVNPATDPTGWTAALGDQGLMFGSAGAETGRVFNSSGILFYEANNSGVLAQIPSGYRSPSLNTLGTTSVAGGTRNIQTITVTGAAVGDYVVPMTNNALPDGILIAWARVSAANTVQICFYNWTAGAIDLVGAQIKALVYRSTF